MLETISTDILIIGGGGAGGFVTTMLSGVDIALWDIKGKSCGKPIYEILGGPLYGTRLKRTRMYRLEIRMLLRHKPKI